MTDRFDAPADRSGGEVAIDTDSAALVAEAEAAGHRVELWTAPTGDRDCLYIRSIWELDASIPTEYGPVGCFDTLPITVDPAKPAPDDSDLLGELDVFPLGHPDNIAGHSR